MSDTLSQECLRVLEACEVDEQSIRLPPDRLPRELYEQVDDVLKRIGGKWHRGAKAHQFPYNPGPLFHAVLSSKLLPPKNPTAFFPTPTGLVRTMVTEALESRWDGCRILEPSAGTGAIASAVRELQRLKDVTWQIDCCEVLDVNREALTNQGFDVVADDFLQFTPALSYDVVIMNPPFSVDGDKQAYITHIDHAWQMLKTGGTLVAITPTGWTYADSKRVREFRDWVATHMSYEFVPAGMFKESGTTIPTMLMYGSKDRSPWKLQPMNGWNSWMGWHSSLYIDNDYELYCKAREADSKDRFPAVLAEAQRQMVKDCCAVVLSEADRDELWNYYSGLAE